MARMLPILILIVVAARPGPAQTNSAVISTTSMALPIIGTAEATNFYNQDVVVTGKVAQVSIRPNITFINLDKRYPESPFAVVIIPDRSHFHGDASALRGQAIEVRGKVANYHGRPEMLLNDTSQLTVVGVTNLALFLQPKSDSTATNAPPKPSAGSP